MIEKTIKIIKLGKNKGDFDYWLKKSPYERIITLESIRQEYNQWRYSDAEQRFQRVLTIIKQK